MTLVLLYLFINSVSVVTAKNVKINHAGRGPWGWGSIPRHVIVNELKIGEIKRSRWRASTGIQVSACWF